jgi:TonB family protein
LFEFSIPTGSVPQSPRPMAVSVAAHGLAFLLIFTLRFSANLSSFSAPQHIILIAPATAIPVNPKRLRVPRPRRFYPPPQARLEISVAPAISAPVFEFAKTVAPDIPKAAVPAPLPAPVAAPKLIVETSGFSTASAVTAPERGTATRAGSTVGSFDSARAVEGGNARTTATVRAGFSDASASSAIAARRGPVASGAFSDTTVDTSAAPRKTSAAARFTPVEILSKPKPAYTDEARQNKIEGEVLLDMQFSASGEARILRMVRGLGHGLDENAVAAASGIRFRPATRDGEAVDSAAVVHIVFQLAN